MRDLKDKRKTGISRSGLSGLLTAAAGLVVMILLGFLCVTDNVEVSRSRKDAGYFQVEDVSCIEQKDDEAPIGIRKDYTFGLGEKLWQRYLPGVLHRASVCGCLSGWGENLQSEAIWAKPYQ